MPAPVPAVDWKKIERDVDDILAPREVEGAIQNRGEAETGKQLWDLSLQQELAHEGSEGDKRRGRDYIHNVAKEAAKAELPPCTFWKRLKGTPCRKGE